MYRRKRILLLASSVIFLCVCLVAGATYALFSEKAPVHTHLKAGTLDATLVRNAYTYQVLDETTGLMKKVPVTGLTDDFTDPSKVTDKNFFGITDEMLIVPKSEFEAVFTVGNNGTTAFDYDIEVVLTDAAGATAEETAANVALANQLYVTMGTQDAAGNRKVLSQGFMNDGAYRLTGDANFKANQERVLVGKSSQQLFVLVQFLDESSTTFGSEVVDNDHAQDGHIKFDLTVTATQNTDPLPQNT